MMHITKTRISFERPLLWGVFIVYLIVSAYAISHHEMWGDEIHSWNIAKGSAGYFDLINNTRYEGHPPVWYTIIWTISKFTHNLSYVQSIHLLIASLTVFLVLFFSPFAMITRILIPFGYYFLYEYAVLSRNYAVGILFAFCICIIIRKNFRYKLLLYYSLLFLMSNTHLLAAILAGSLHLYFLLLLAEQKQANKIIIHIVLGILIFLPSVYFIFPPSDGQLNIHFWINKWEPQHLKAFGQAPLRSFFPVPAWWKYNFWNTHFLLDMDKKIKLVNLVVSAIPLVLAFFVLRRNKKSLILFGTNLLLSFFIALIFFPMTSARYAGFLYIGFIAAYWLCCYEIPATSKHKWMINALLAIQLACVFFVISKDIRLPFSNAYRVNELIIKAPKNERIVSDYWALDAIAAFVDKPFYCIDLRKEMFFILWDNDLKDTYNKPYRYLVTVSDFFRKESVHTVYMISTNSPKILLGIDPQLPKSYRLQLIYKIEGSIEKGGNLYLYKISNY